MKKQINESDAVDLFFQIRLDGVSPLPEALIRSLTKTNSSFNEQDIIDKKVARMEYDLALAALELYALRNLFPKEQSERIQQMIFVRLSKTEEGKKQVAEIINYGKLIYFGTIIPLGMMAEKILERWLGVNIKSVLFKTEYLEESHINPMSLIAVGTFLTTGTHFWKMIFDDYELIS